MLSNELQKTLIDHIASLSPHEDHRKYIGLSSIGDCEQIIYDRYVNGQPSSNDERLKHALAYDYEGVIIDRLLELGLYHKAPAIELHLGMVLGHPDGEVNGDLLEIKTVPSADRIPVPPRLPNRAFYQVQAYMHYGGYRRCHVIYIARDTGHIRVVGVSYSPMIGNRIETKLIRIVAAIRNHQRPACTCGWCNKPEDERNQPHA